MKSSRDTFSDIVSAEYWDNRFASGDTPWDLGRSSVVLFEALSLWLDSESCGEKVRSLAGKTVVLPGCGSGSDALELAKSGASVLAVDWSLVACERLRSRMDESIQAIDGAGIEVVYGDFFSVAPAPVDLICEHTFFCAIAPSRRSDYVSTVGKWLQPGGYLVGNFFVLTDSDAQQLEGFSLAQTGVAPPFVSTEEQLFELFSGDFQIEVLRPATQGEPGRRAGMEWIGVFRRR